MLTIAEDALALIEKKHLPITVSVPPSISGCCIEITESPSVSFGVPTKTTEYTMQLIQGVTVYVPKCLNLLHPLTIRSKGLFGFQWLYIDGWRLV